MLNGAEFMGISTGDYMAMEARLRSKNISINAERAEPVERDLHSKIKAECRTRGWICLTGSMAHRAMRTIGEPDFTIMADKGRVFFIEAKSKLGKLRPEQAALRVWAKKLGHEIHVIRDFTTFLQLTKP